MRHDDIPLRVDRCPECDTPTLEAFEVKSADDPPSLHLVEVGCVECGHQWTENHAITRRGHV